MKRIAIIVALVLPLLIAVGGGMVTLWLAIEHGDRSLPIAIRKKGPVQFGTADATAEAAAQHLRGELSWTGDRIHLQLAGAGDARLRLVIWHSTAAMADRNIELTAVADGQYEGRGEKPAGAWQALLEPIDRRFALQAARIGVVTILEPMP